MGHYNIAKVLLQAGADPHPPIDLFCNIWDPNELKRLVKNLEDYIDLEYFLPSLLDEAALQFMKMGQMSNAEDYYRRVVEGWEKAYGVEDIATLYSVSQLARVLQHQGKYEAAEELHRRALEGMEKALGRDHLGTMTSAYNLASLFHKQKQYDEASVLYLRASEWLSKTLGPDDPRTQKCLQDHSAMIREMENQDRDVRHPQPKV